MPSVTRCSDSAAPPPINVGSCEPIVLQDHARRLPNAMSTGEDPTHWAFDGDKSCGILVGWSSGPLRGQGPLPSLILFLQMDAFPPPVKPNAVCAGGCLLPTAAWHLLPTKMHAWQISFCEAAEICGESRSQPRHLNKALNLRHPRAPVYWTGDPADLWPCAETAVKQCPHLHCMDCHHVLICRS